MLTERGHEVLLFCQSGSPLAEWTRDDKFAVDRSMNLNRTNPKEIFAGIQRFKQAIRDFQPDLLNPHCPPGHSFFALARKLEGSQVPLIRTVAEPRFPKNNTINRYLHEKQTNGMIYTTASSCERYRQSFQMTHIPQAVVLPGFYADQFVEGVQALDLRAELGLDSDRIIFGIVARMSPEKGQEVLIEALSLLNEAIRSKCHFILTGDNSRQRGANDLKALAEQKEVESLLTFQERYADIRPFIAGLDVGLITSVRSEAVCRIALEYMSFAKPIISSDVNILPEVVRNGENGWIYRNRNAQELAHCIHVAIQNSEERQKRGQRGYELVHSEFSMDHYIEQTLQFYKSVIEARRTRG